MREEGEEAPRGEEEKQHSSGHAGRGSKHISAKLVHRSELQGTLDQTTCAG